MLLAENTPADVAYAVRQASKFTHRPRQANALAIERILRYLKNTKDMGMILRPNGTSSYCAM